jgi:hypothetical protein
VEGKSTRAHFPSGGNRLIAFAVTCVTYEVIAAAAGVRYNPFHDSFDLRRLAVHVALWCVIAAIVYWSVMRLHAFRRTSRSGSPS